MCWGAADLVAAGILSLWFLPSLAVLIPAGWSQMTANAALGMLFATGSLALSRYRSPAAIWISRAAAVAVLALGCLTLVEYCGISLGIDDWLPSAASATFPGRPSPQTSLGFTLVGISLALIQQSKNRLSIMADVSAMALVVLLLVLLCGHLYRIVEMIGVNVTNLTSPQTLFCFVLLAFVIVCRRATGGGTALVCCLRL